MRYPKARLHITVMHQTTGHTLCYALALLALYPAEQDKCYQHIKTLLRNNKELPVRPIFNNEEYLLIPYQRYEDVNHYTYATAYVSLLWFIVMEVESRPSVFYETLRLFPSVAGIPKQAAEDSVVKARNAAGGQLDVHIPRNTEILLDTPGLHYNRTSVLGSITALFSLFRFVAPILAARYWDDPETFRPSRFLEKDWPRDAFFPFSGGSRACLGRRFAEVEAVAVLVMFISRYTVAVKEELRYAHETFEQRRERVLKSYAGITLTCVPL